MTDQELSSLETASNDADPERFHEAYEIVRTVELVHDAEVFRIEILKRYPATRDRRFSSHVYRFEEEQWRRLTVGSVYHDSPDAALSQTISFLRDVSHPKRRTGA